MDDHQPDLRRNPELTNVIARYTRTHRAERHATIITISIAVTPGPSWWAPTATFDHARQRGTGRIPAPTFRKCRRPVGEPRGSVQFVEGPAYFSSTDIAATTRTLYFQDAATARPGRSQTGLPPRTGLLEECLEDRTCSRGTEQVCTRRSTATTWISSPTAPPVPVHDGHPSR